VLTLRELQHCRYRRAIGARPTNASPRRGERVDQASKFHGRYPPHRSDDVPRLRELTKPPFRERVERYLVAAADKAKTLDAWLKVGQEELMGVSYSDHVNELNVVIDYLRQEGLLTNNLRDSERLTPKGYIAADELRAKRAASS
jgi:hypothetical protein